MNLRARTSRSTGPTALAATRKRLGGARGTYLDSACYPNLDCAWVRATRACSTIARQPHGTAGSRVRILRVESGKAESVPQPPSGAAIGGAAISVWCVHSNNRGMVHSRYREVAKGVKVGTLALPAYLTGELRDSLVAVVPLGKLPPLLAQGSVDNRVEPESCVIWVEVECDESEAREVLTLIHFDEGSSLGDEEVA